MSAQITRLIILINVGVYILELATGYALIYPFALWPLDQQFHSWQIVTYAFLHGNLTHILFNMFGLAIFGSGVERHLGATRDWVASGRGPFCPLRGYAGRLSSDPLLATAARSRPTVTSGASPR